LAIITMQTMPNVSPEVIADLEKALQDSLLPLSGKTTSKSRKNKSRRISARRKKTNKRF
jgi:flagellar motor switch protein FliG